MNYKALARHLKLCGASSETSSIILEQQCTGEEWVFMMKDPSVNVDQIMEENLQITSPILRSRFKRQISCLLASTKPSEPSQGIPAGSDDVASSTTKTKLDVKIATGLASLATEMRKFHAQAMEKQTEGQSKIVKDMSKHMDMPTCPAPSPPSLYPSRTDWEDYVMATKLHWDAVDVKFSQLVQAAANPAANFSQEDISMSQHEKECDTCWAA